MKKIIVLFVVLFVIIFANCYVSAVDLTNALKEINEVKVLVENLPDEFTKAGLTRSEFQTTAELFLRRNGIKVVDKESAGYRTPFLYIRISILSLKNKGGSIIGYAYHVLTNLQLSFVDTKKYGFLFNVPILKSIPNWGTAPTINNTRENVKINIREDLEEIANQYLKAHQEKIKE